MPLPVKYLNMKYKAIKTEIPTNRSNALTIPSEVTLATSTA